MFRVPFRERRKIILTKNGKIYRFIEKKNMKVMKKKHESPVFEVIMNAENNKSFFVASGPDPSGGGGVTVISPENGFAGKYSAAKGVPAIFGTTSPF